MQNYRWFGFTKTETDFQFSAQGHYLTTNINLSETKVLRQATYMCIQKVKY